MFSDCHFIYGICTTALAHASVSKTPTYLYRVSIETELNFLKKFLKIQVPGKSIVTLNPRFTSSVLGVSHLDDVGYLFKNITTPEIVPNTIEDTSVRRFVKLWTNFAKIGNPIPGQNDPLLPTVWKPVTNENLDFLDIGRDLVPRRNPYPDRMKFWKQLFAESPAGQGKPT